MLALSLDETKLYSFYGVDNVKNAIFASKLRLKYSME